MKDFIKPPFANYDVVVYFGSGLFAVPILFRYVLSPFDLSMPVFYASKQGDVVGEIIRFLEIAFTVYILGHMIAFFGSNLIEKTFDRYFGKVSSYIILSAASTSSKRNEALRALFYDRASRISQDGASFSATVRALFHVPVIVHYFVMWFLGIFGFFDTRVPQSVITRLKEKYRLEVMPGQRVSIRTKWYKAVEYFVINRCPDAVPRMYNYLVISGLFRSLSVIFLSASWLLLYYGAHWAVDREWLLPDSIFSNMRFGWVIEFIALSSASVFCSVSYLKFQRRYAEEVVFAFVFNKGASELSHDLGSKGQGHCQSYD